MVSELPGSCAQAILGQAGPWQPCPPSACVTSSLQDEASAIFKAPDLNVLNNWYPRGYFKPLLVLLV